tara:strand:+ start:1232 stop:3304 length:2073 start_codon:yes stop_codon:yes gene_type:complete
MFKYYLNGIQVSDPINWTDFTETITRSKELNGLLITYDAQLSFNGDAYNILYNLYTDNGLCTLVDIVVEQNVSGTYENVLTGYIFISDCKFHLSKCIVDCTVIDNNYNARISNNKNIAIYLDSTLSKNEETISACVNNFSTWFRPSNGFPITGLRKTYSVYSVFKYFIDFMTDGTVDFKSDYLNWQLTATPPRQLAITTGAIIRNVGSGASPKLSFETLMQEVSKKYPLAFTIETQSSGRPLFRLENEDYFLQGDSGVSILNIDDVQQSFDQLKLYSEIGIGGTTANYNASIHSLPTDLIMFFESEKYYFKTQCNIDNALDLVSQFICDSNIIEELVYTNTTNDSYDDNIFFVEINYSGGIAGNTPKETQLYTTSAYPVIYNGRLRNSIVAQNFNFYSDLISYINSNDIGFMATKTSNYAFNAHDLADYTYGFAGIINPLISPYNLIAYQNDSTPPNNNTAGNFTTDTRYTAPNNGNYYFKSQVSCQVSTLLPASSLPYGKNIAIQFELEIRKYDSSSTLIATHREKLTGSFGETVLQDGYQVFANYNANYFTLSADYMYFLEAGDYVETYCRWISVPYASYNAYGIYNLNPTNARVVLLDDGYTYFKTITTEGNGLLVEGNMNNYNVESLEFSVPMNNANYNILKQDPSKKINISYLGVNSRNAWINTSIRNLATGEMKWKLVTNLDNA